jgi:hypothetical protein
MIFVSFFLRFSSAGLKEFSVKSLIFRCSFSCGFTSLADNRVTRSSPRCLLYRSSLSSNSTSYFFCNNLFSLLSSLLFHVSVDHNSYDNHQCFSSLFVSKLPSSRTIPTIRHSARKGSAEQCEIVTAKRFMTQAGCNYVECLSGAEHFALGFFRQSVLRCSSGKVAKFRCLRELCGASSLVSVQLLTFNKFHFRALLAKTMRKLFR